MKKTVVSIITVGVVALNAVAVASEAVPQITTAGRALSSVEQNIENTSAIFNQQSNETNLNTEEIKNKQSDDSDKSDLKIMVKSFVYTGDLLYTADLLNEQLLKYIGKELTLKDLKNAAEVVAGYYQQQGYIMTQAYLPPQDLSTGSITIAISVAKYGDIKIDNIAKLPNGLVNRELGQVKKGAYIYKPALDRALLFMNDLSGINAKADLKPGTTPGSSDFILNLSKKDQLFSTMLSADNYGNASTGRNEFTLGLSWYNLSNNGDSLNVNWLTTDDQMNSGSIAYSMPFSGKQGSTLSLSYSHVYYTLGKQFAVLNYLGTADTTLVTYSMPLERNRTGNQTLSFSYNYKVLSNDIQAYSLSSTNYVSEAFITYSGNYYDQVGMGAYNSYNLTGSWGNLTVDNANMAYDAATTKIAGDYGTLNGGWTREQALTDRWQLHLALSGQLASKNLNGSEELTLTGPYAVRAWSQGEYSGDEGWLGTAEFKYAFPKNAKQRGQFTWALFYDAGGIQVNKFTWAGYNADNSVELQGWGTGLIWQDAESQWYVRGDVAWKLSGPSSTKQNQDGGNGEMYWLKIVKMM